MSNKFLVNGIDHQCGDERAIQSMQVQMWSSLWNVNQNMNKWMVKWVSWPCQEKTKKESFTVLTATTTTTTMGVPQFVWQLFVFACWNIRHCVFFPWKCFVEYKRHRGGETEESGRREETKNKKLNWCQQPSFNRKKVGGGGFLFLYFFFFSFALLSLVGKVSLSLLSLCGCFVVSGEDTFSLCVVYVCRSHS